MAPLSDAAALQLHPPSMGVVHTRSRASTSHDHHALSTDPRADAQEDKIYAPLLSMPKSSEGSGDLGSKSDRKSDGDSDGKDISEGDESKHASHGDQGSVSKKEKAKDEVGSSLASACTALIT